jgi:hypothetical protein
VASSFSWDFGRVVSENYVAVCVFIGNWVCLAVLLMLVDVELVYNDHTTQLFKYDIII